jgi:CRP/FNR family transcriptional regulator, cyclic AMP receptor protein
MDNRGFGSTGNGASLKRAIDCLGAREQALKRSEIHAASLSGRWQGRLHLTRRTYAPDETLFRQGDPSDFAILILSGSADVLRQVGDDAIVLGTVHAGEFVGEMGVLEGRARSASVRAAAPLEADLIERQVFLDRVSHEPELARKLLLRMSVRLRDVEDTLARVYAERSGGHGGGRDLVQVPPAPPIELTATTYGAQSFVGTAPVRITRLPFTVGRAPSEHETASMIPVDLAIREPAPYRLSRAHFSIVAHDGEVLVRDLNSMLGTLVNDRPLGRDFPAESAPLHKGENTVVAGGRGSPFTFKVTLS